jgi:hypothetical protein
MTRLAYLVAVFSTLLLTNAAGAQNAMTPPAPSTTPSAAAGQGPATAGAAHGTGVTGAGSGTAAHRQPTPSTLTSGTGADGTHDPRDAALDRALRSICRGC